MEERVVLCWTEDGNVARLYGELDLSTRTRFESLLLDALECGEGYFAVDLNHLRFMDSQGLHMLSRIRDRCEERGRRFYLLCAGGPCRKVLEAAGVNGAFDLKRRCADIPEGATGEYAVLDPPCGASPRHRGKESVSKGGKRCASR